MHHWLVWLVLEVTIPTARAEVGCGPRLHLLELLFGWASLDTGVNAVGGQWSRTLDIPLIEDPLLNFWVTPDKVIERLCIRLGSVRGKGEIVVLEVEADTREVDDGLDTNFAEFLWVTNTRSLENKR
jgi:hypothetical protein